MIELAEAIRDAVDRTVKRYSGWGESEAARNRGAGTWSRKEILGHLIDSAANNHQRFVRAQFASPLVGPGYDQNAWVALHRYRERPWAELLTLWAALNRHVASVVESVPPEKLQTPCVIGEQAPAPLEWWMRDYLRHLRHHLGQIESD